MRLRTPAILATIVLLAIPVTAGAWLDGAFRKFDRTAELRAGGSKVTVHGPLVEKTGDCVPGEPASIRVTLTQRGTEALATGTWRGSCKGGKQAWRTTVRVVGEERFRAGRARACALGIFRGLDGTRQFVKQWCRTLVLK